MPCSGAAFRRRARSGSSSAATTRTTAPRTSRSPTGWRWWRTRRCWSTPATSCRTARPRSTGRTSTSSATCSDELPALPAIGNHDTESLPNWYRFFALPGNERWYSFRCGNAAFHALNVYDSMTPGSSQYEWLLAELAADSADPDVRHVFVYFHLPPYTTNTVYSGNADVRQYLCPLFERFGVRIVFSGHVHAYEHSLVNGVHYIITGGGGASLARNWNAVQPWTVYREATYEFVLVDVRGDTVFSRGVRPDGSEFDSLVVVTGHVGCAEPGDALKRRTRTLPRRGKLRVEPTRVHNRAGGQGDGDVVRRCRARGRASARHAPWRRRAPSAVGPARVAGRGLPVRRSFRGGRTARPNGRLLRSVRRLASLTPMPGVT